MHTWLRPCFKLDFISDSTTSPTTEALTRYYSFQHQHYSIKDISHYTTYNNYKNFDHLSPLTLIQLHFESTHLFKLFHHNRKIIFRTCLNFVAFNLFKHFRIRPNKTMSRSREFKVRKLLQR